MNWKNIGERVVSGIVSTVVGTLIVLAILALMESCG